MVQGVGVQAKNSVELSGLGTTTGFSSREWRFHRQKVWTSNMKPKRAFFISMEELEHPIWE